MTTIVACRKNKKIAIGADSLISFSGESLAHDNTGLSKLIKTPQGIFAFAGDAAIHNAFYSYIKLCKLKIPVKDPKTYLYKLFCDFLKFIEDDCGYIHTSNDSTFKLLCGFLFASNNGIWHVDSQRAVTEINKFFAIGSGREYALGAAYNFYSGSMSAAEIVQCALKTSCYFDLHSAEPLEIVEL